MTRFMLTPVVLLTALYALLHVGFALADSAAPTGGVLVKLSVASVLLAHGAATLRLLWHAPLPGPLQLFSVWAGGLALIALGSANAVWAAHLGLVTGDWEYYSLVGGAVILTQGVLAVWIVGPGSSPVPSRR